MRYALLLVLVVSAVAGSAGAQAGNCYNCYSDGTYLYCSLLQPSGGLSCSQSSPYNCTLTGACGSGGGCFLMGTLVPTDDGLKPIEELSAGIAVRSVDVDGNDTRAVVTRTYKSIECGYLVINGTLRVTGTHPFFVDGEWVEAANLKVGDWLTGASGPVEVTSLTKVDGVVRAYNISVDGAHTFWAGGFLVHNKQHDQEG